MAKVVKRDNTTSYIAGMVLILLVAGFGLLWQQQQNVDKNPDGMSYQQIGPLTVHSHGYAMMASLSIQTSSADTDWAEERKKALDTTLQTALTDSDPELIREPNGLQSLQNSLTDKVNAAFKTTKVERVLLTDFVMQAD